MRIKYKNFKYKFNFIKENEKGTAIVIVALALSTLMIAAALVTDVGLLYLERSRLVRASEAAALAGAGELPEEDEAYNTADQFAIKNDLEPGSYEIEVIKEESRVVVSAVSEVSMAFARVMGITEQKVAGSASAIKGNAKGLMGAAPFGIPEEEFGTGEEYVLREAPPGHQNEDEELEEGEEDRDEEGAGNFGILALGDPGADTVRENIKEGYEGYLEIGDLVDTEPGFVSGPVRDGIEHLLDECDEECEEDYSDCPRLLVIPIIDRLPDGKDEVEILGFGAFHINEFDKGDKEVKGEFVDYMTIAETANDVEDFGVYNIKLTD